MLARWRARKAGMHTHQRIDLSFLDEPLPTPADLPPDWRPLFEELAGIYEFEGGLSRDRAEASALADTAARMRPSAMPPAAAG